MKFARFLFPLALLLATAGSSYGQMPMSDPAMMGGQAMGAPGMMGDPALCGPEMMGGQAMGDPGFSMSPGPVYSDCPPFAGRAPFARLRQRTSRGYFSADAFIVHRKDSAPRTIVQVGAQPFLYTSDLNYGYQTAPRMTAGFVLGNDIALEGTAFYKDDLDAHTDNVSVAGALTSPLINTISPVNFTNANLIDLRLATGIHSYELNMVETSRIFRFIAGFRYMEVRDRMTVVASQGAATSDATIGTYNHLFGGQIGMRTGYDWELFGFEVAGKAGMFFNDGQATTFFRDQNNTVTTRNVRVGGQNEAFAGELSAKVSYRPLPYLALQAGYQCFWITETALAPDQLNTINPLNSGLALNAHGDLFYHGPSVGAELRW